MQVFRRALRLLCVLAALNLCACQDEPPPVAKLETTSGKVDRDFAGKVGAFSLAALGDEFGIGDGIRTSKASSAALRLGDGSGLSLDEATLVRFLERPSGSKRQRMDVEMGQAVLTAGSKPLDIETAFGTAVIQPNSKVVLTRSKEGVRFEVAIGSAVLDLKGQKTELATGSKIEVGMDLAVIEQSGPGAPAASSAAPAASAAPVPVDSGIKAEISGEGARVKPPGATAFEKLPPGEAALQPGSVLELSGGTSARVRSGGEETALSGPGQFVVGASDATSVQAQGGTIELAPTRGPVQVTVPGGTITAQAGSRASLSTDKTGTTVSVASGEVTLQSSKGSETLHGGEEAVLERSGSVRRSRRRGLDYADLLAAAGDSFVVHDPRPPTAVGFVVPGACKGSASLELGKGGGLVGEKTINAALKGGTHRYSVRCIGEDGKPGEVVAKGVISVVADGGTRRLPSSAPATTVEADGRNYTVLYQNQLPKIVARWPKAPASGPFSISVRSSNGRLQTVSAQTAQHTFGSGSLTEGTHKLTFEAGGRRSKPTTIDIRFDNATPTASLSSPGDGSFGPGSQVLVAGTALPGWVITVGGVGLPMDAQQRFSGQATAPSGERALAIRFAHAQRGTHYYLRRVAGAGR
jgi:ferric-dicitrate binding protein FerR (iron transport regulator)